MKAVSQDYKTQIKELGREIDSKITYTISGTTTTLNSSDINSIVLHYDGGILRSVMKQLDVECNTNIPLNTQITAQFGLKVNGIYEYINLGNFVVYSSEKIEESNTYKLICYDKMLYAMKDYEDLGITYPITIRDYIGAICTHLGLTFANSSDTFANYDKLINNELYLDEEGNSLNYTFRDVLGELAQVTASTICINNNDELEIRYINNTSDTINEEYLKDINVNFGDIINPINTITFKRSADTDVISLSNPIDLADNLKNEIVISDNQILNGDNRDTFLSDILTRLYGLTYSLNDFNSTGITYYELCDKYSVSIDNVTYTCIMFNDEINISNGGLQEYIYTDRPEENPTDYNTTTQSDRRNKRTDLIVDKQNGSITAITEELQIDDDGNSQVIESIKTTQTQNSLDIEAITSYEEIDGVRTLTGVKTSKGFTFNSGGLEITSSENAYKTKIDETGQYHYDNDTMIGKYDKDGSVQKNLALFGKYYYGVDENVNVETFNKDDAMFVSQLYEYDDGNGNTELGFGHFYNGS